MAAPSVMIGMMKCNINGVDCGSVKSASVTVKPQYKEHKTGYPQISDLKALLVAEGVCKVDSEESVLNGTVTAIAVGLSSGSPINVPFEGNAPGLGGTALTISGNGFGSGSGLFGKMEDFGYASAETTCINLSFTGNQTTAIPNTAGGIDFITPSSGSQAITTSKENLIYGAPTVGGDLCQQAQFQCSSKTRYLAMAWPPTIDAAVMENTEFSITASFSDGSAGALTEVTANMVPGTVAAANDVTMSIPTIGGGTVGITMKAIVEADLSFNPGNDWNGVAVKYSAILTDPALIGTNWAGIS